MLDVPITPPLHGCELLELTPGREAYIAGWGATGAGGAGTKHWAQTEIAMVFDHWLHVGEDGIGTASGDSGSGAFVRLEDGGWRSIGAASTGGQPGSYVRTDLVIGWVERNAGVDITPCTDAVGTWMPTEACGGFAADPLAGGEWAAGCAVGGVSGPASTCGPAFGEPPAPLPAVAITAPAEDAQWDDDSITVDLSLTAEHPWPLRRAWIEIDGRALPDLHTAPLGYEDVVFPRGSFTLVARAQDYGGAIGDSAPVVVTVGIDEPAGADSTGDGGQGDTADGGDPPVPPQGTTTSGDDGPVTTGAPEPATDDTAGAPSSSGGDGGSGGASGGGTCRVGGRRPQWSAILAVVLLAARRRRR